MLRRPRWAGALALVLAATVLPAIATTPTTAAAAAACSPSSGRSVGGTVEGEDGRYVSAQVSIEFFTADGTKVGTDGCPMGGGYAVTDLVNESSSCCFILPGEGSTSGTYGQWQLEKTWQVTTIPANAHTIWFEVWPKRAGGQPNTADERYGYAMRRPVAIGNGRNDIDFRLPLQCRHGGSTGDVLVYNWIDGRLVEASQVGVWSSDPDSETKILGWGWNNGGGDELGRTLVQHVYPGNHWVLSTVNGVTHRRQAAVRACETTRVDVVISGSVPVGTDTPGVVRDGTWLLRNSNTSGPADITIDGFGPGDGLYVAGDWDGDGIDTIGVVVGNTFYLRNSLDSGDADIVVGYGRPGDTPVIGDWNGDGIDTIGVRRNNVFYLRNANTTGIADITLGYGKGSDTPVVGDWNGDGIDTFGIRRGNSYYLRNSNSTGIADITYAYGAGTDIPIAGDWDGV